METPGFLYSTLISSYLGEDFPTVAGGKVSEGDTLPYGIKLDGPICDQKVPSPQWTPGCVLFIPIWAKDRPFGHANCPGLACLTCDSLPACGSGMGIHPGVHIHVWETWLFQ